MTFSARLSASRHESLIVAQMVAAVLLLAMFGLASAGVGSVVAETVVPQPAISLAKFTATLDHTLPSSSRPPPEALAAVHFTSISNGPGCFGRPMSGSWYPVPSDWATDQTDTAVDGTLALSTLELELFADQLGLANSSAPVTPRLQQWLPEICAWVAAAMNVQHVFDCNSGSENGEKAQMSSAVLSHYEHMSTAQGRPLGRPLGRHHGTTLRVAMQFADGLESDVQLLSPNDPRSFIPLTTCYTRRSWSRSAFFSTVQGTFEPAAEDAVYEVDSPSLRSFTIDPVPESQQLTRVYLRPDSSGPSLHPSPTLHISIPITPDNPYCPSSKLRIQSWLPASVFMDPYQMALRASPEKANTWSIYGSTRLPDLEHPYESQYATPHWIVGDLDVSHVEQRAAGQWGGAGFSEPVPLHLRYQQAVESGVDANVRVGPFVVACAETGGDDGFFTVSNPSNVVGVSNGILVRVPRARKEDRAWVVKVTSVSVLAGALVLAAAVAKWGPREQVAQGGGGREKTE